MNRVSLKSEMRYNLFFKSYTYTYFSFWVVESGKKIILILSLWNLTAGHLYTVSNQGFLNFSLSLWTESGQTCFKQISTWKIYILMAGDYSRSITSIDVTTSLSKQSDLNITFMFNIGIWVFNTKEAYSF